MSQLVLARNQRDKNEKSAVWDYVREHPSRLWYIVPKLDAKESTTTAYSYLVHNAQYHIWWTEKVVASNRLLTKPLTKCFLLPA